MERVPDEAIVVISDDESEAETQNEDWEMVAACLQGYVLAAHACFVSFNPEFFCLLRHLEISSAVYFYVKEMH